MAEAWAIKAGAAGLELRCRHPRPVRALLTEIELHWADGQQQRIERPSKQRGSALIGPLAAGRDQPERIEARLDLGREMDGLRRLAPSGEGLKAWLASLRSRPRRWRGLVLAASCGDPCITVAPAYDDSFLPLLLRLALLEPVEDPALGVLMAFSRKGRQRRPAHPVAALRARGPGPPGAAAGPKPAGGPRPRGHGFRRE